MIGVRRAVAFKSVFKSFLEEEEMAAPTLTAGEVVPPLWNKECQ